MNLTNVRPEVTGIVLESTFGKLSEALTKGIYGLPIRWLGEERLSGLVQYTFARNFDTEEFLKAGQENPPVFILHGSSDWTVKASAVPRLIEACLHSGRPHRSYVVKGGGHNDLHTPTWANEVQLQILDWMMAMEIQDATTRDYPD